ALLLTVTASTAATVGARQEDVTEVRMIGERPVLFQYGRPVPAFLLTQDPNPHRQIISLDGEWAFAPGRSEGDPNVPPGRELDASAWIVEVPHIWDFEPGLETFDGPVWYEKRFHLPARAESTRIRLVFLGAADEATVYVNGARAGYHRG